MLATRLLVCFEFFDMVSHLLYQWALDLESPRVDGLAAGLRSATVADGRLDTNARTDPLYTGRGTDGDFTSCHRSVSSFL